MIKSEFDILSKDFNVYGVFLYGSQNYGLSTEESDVDTKAIILPSFHDLVLKQPVSKVMDFEWGECDVKDIREMMKSYKKQNVNFIETLFTDYFYVNPRYQSFHDELLSLREEIAHLDEHRAIDCFNGLLMQSKKRLFQYTEKTAPEILRYGYHRKSLMNICKCYSMLWRYIEGLPYKEVLDCHELINVRDAVIPLEDVKSFVESIDGQAREMIKAAYKTVKPRNDDLSYWLDEWMIRLLCNCNL